MAQDNRLESLNNLLELFKTQQEAVKKQLHLHIDMTVDGLIGQLVSGIKVWAASSMSQQPNNISNIDLIFNSSINNNIPPNVTSSQSPHDPQLPPPAPLQDQMNLSSSPSTSNNSSSQNSQQPLFSQAGGQLFQKDPYAFKRCRIKPELIHDDEVDHITTSPSDESQPQPRPQQQSQPQPPVQNRYRSQTNDDEYIKEEVINLSDNDDEEEEEEEEDDDDDDDISEIMETQFQNLNHSSTPIKQQRQSNIEQYEEDDENELDDDDEEIQYAESQESQQQHHPAAQFANQSYISTQGFSSSKYNRIISLKCQSSNCGQMLPNRELFNQHLAEMHQIWPHRCYHSDCLHSFRTGMELSLHIRVFHEDVREWSCGACERYFKEHDGLAAHIFHHHTEGAFGCGKEGCSFTASYQAEVTRHYTQSHCEFTCQWPGCGKSFRYKSVLATHKRSHSGLKLFRCTWPACSFACNDRSSIVKHIRTQHFKLPRSKKVQRAQNIVDNRDVNDFIGTNDFSSSSIDPNAPSTSRSHPNPIRLRMKLYRCKWDMCNFSSEYKMDVVKHIKHNHPKMKRHS